MPVNLRKRCTDTYQGCLNDPKRIVKYGVLFVCSIIMIFQLTECFSKLYFPPITTHSHFDLNDTISYPALTICRDPGYKAERMAHFNLPYHPRFTNGWRNFNFAGTNMREMFYDVTYSADEVFGQYGLEGDRENVKIISDLYFNYGQCHTILPQKPTRGSSRNNGYSMVLHHDLTWLNETTSDFPPGWHIFLHEPKENFTEINMQTSGRGEYMYIRVGEEVEIKLTAQHFNMLSSNENNCTNDRDYSVIRCLEMCQWTKITTDIGCSGPWMPGITKPYCSNYTQMKDLIVQYQTLTDTNIDECGCVEPCQSLIYSAFVMCRNSFVDQPMPSSQIWLYYASKMVTVFEERPGYDLTQFVADMGGSLGFLLGLSVLGLIGVLEKITATIFNRILLKRKIREEAAAAEAAAADEQLTDSNNAMEKNGGKSIQKDLSSTTTVDAASVEPIHYGKY